METGLKYNKVQKMNKNFMYQDLKRSNCYNSDFSNSNFNFTSLRGAHFKSCNFYGCTFTFAEFIGSNLKKSRFTKAGLFYAAKPRNNKSPPQSLPPELPTR